MKLSLISDEVSQKLAVAAEFAHRYGIEGLELRSVENVNIFSFTDEQARETARVMQGEGLAVSCLSAPLYKFDIDDEGARARCVKSFKRAVEHCALLGCGLMLSATEIPRIAQQFGLDTTTRANVMSAVYATQTVVNLTRNLVSAAAK